MLKHKREKPENKEKLKEHKVGIKMKAKLAVVKRRAKAAADDGEQGEALHPQGDGGLCAHVGPAARILTATVPQTLRKGPSLLGLIPQPPHPVVTEDIRNVPKI